MTAINARDSVIFAAGTRTVPLPLPPYYNEIQIGAGHTPSGAAFEVLNGILYIDNIYGGSGSFSNQYYDTYGCTASSVRNHEAFMGIATNGALTGSQTHGVRGQNNTLGTSGLIGVANGYDFYADGAGTNYGPFTGTHDAVIRPADVNGLILGDIVCDVECVSRRDISNTLFRVEPCGGQQKRSALGVICAIHDWSEDRVIAALQTDLEVTDTEFMDANGNSHIQKKVTPVRSADYATLKNAGYKLLAVNAVGEGQINVCGQNGNIAAGDLIVVSSKRGKGMKQDDDIVRSYTVARAREACTFQNPADEKTIACIYVSG